jgi:hypothetical protein
MSYVDIRDVDVSGFYRIGKAGYGGDSTDVSNLIQAGVTSLYSTVGAFAALKYDGSVVTWGGVEGIISVNPWFVDLSYNIAYLDGKYVGIGKYNPPTFQAGDKNRMDISAEVYMDGVLYVADISSTYLENVKSEWERRPSSALTYTKGNIGIGKTNPSATLDVNGTVHVSNNFTVNQSLLRADVGSQSVSIGHGSTATVNATLDVSGSFINSGDSLLGNSTLFVDSCNNRVGIRDTTPQFTLDVCGSAQFRNLNTQMTTQTIFRIPNLTQARLGDPTYVRLANTNTAILFQATTTTGNYNNLASPIVLYIFDTPVTFTQIQFALDINNGVFLGVMSHRLFIVDKDGAFIPNTEFTWTQLTNGITGFSLTAPTIASLTSDRFPIRVLYTYDATFTNTFSQYFINDLNVNVSYRSSALQVIGNMNVLEGTISIGKVVSTGGSVPTVDISGSLSVSKDVRIGNHNLIVNTETHNIGIGREPASNVILDVSSAYTGNIVRISNPGLSAGSTVAMTLGRENTTTNQYQFIYEYIAADSSENRLLIGTPDISNLFCIEANRNVGIGLGNVRPTCRLSLGSHSSARTLALHENSTGDRFYGFGAQYSATGDISNALHIYARTSGALTNSFGQLIVTELGNIGISTNQRPIDRRLVIGNRSTSTGSFIEFDNRADYDPLTASIYRGYAIGSSVNESGASRQGQLQFIYTGSPVDGERNDILMAMNSSGFVGIGVNPSIYILDVSRNAPSRIASSSLNITAPGSETNTMTVDTASGTVAINKNTATNTLDVNGTVHVSSYVNISGDLIVDGTTLYVDSQRNRVGISTVNPIHSCDISGALSIQTNRGITGLTGDVSSNGIILRNINENGGSVIQLRNNTAIDSAYFALGGSANLTNLYTGTTYGSNAILHSNQGWAIGTSGEKVVRLYTNNTERMRIDHLGNVGIGTSLASSSYRAKVIIEGFQSFPDVSRATAFNYGGSNTSITIDTRPISLYCSHNVVCNSIIVFSDERIKKEVKPLLLDDSLDKIDRLKPVSYQYIDRLKGEGTQSGFIAQDVKKVIPEAVTTMLDYVPDIYTMVEITNSSAVPLNESYVYPEKCEMGSVIMAYNDQNQFIQFIVIEVKSNRNIRIARIDGSAIPDGVYFLYGSQVKDFHIVDTNVIVSHCVAAVKSVIDRQRKQQLEIDELREMVRALSAKIQ